MGEALWYMILLTSLMRAHCVPLPEPVENKRWDMSDACADLSLEVRNGGGTASALVDAIVKQRLERWSFVHRAGTALQATSQNQSGLRLTSAKLKSPSFRRGHA
jgi:hypothetical protein